MDKDILNDFKIEKGLSLRELARQTGVSANQYSKYLKGSIPTIPIAIKIADFMKCSLDYMFGLKEENYNYKPQNKYDISKFVDRYKNLLEINKTTHWKFSKQFGISESALRHWQYGDMPKIESLIIIATNLSTSIEYLIGRTDKM